jgi:hypothetical protein
MSQQMPDVEEDMVMCHQQKNTRLAQEKRFHLHPPIQEIMVGEF